MPASRFRRSVCTFHDLFVMTGDYSTPEFRARFTSLARQAAERADLIIAVSHFTAGQVESLLRVEPARLRVIPHGVRFVPSGQVEEQREKIVLHVGAIQTRKNIARLVRAFARSAPADWRLVLAGSDGYGAGELRELIRSSPAAERIRVTGWVSDVELQRWFMRASILAFPSLDEGFGIPALEAMACGLPVLSSNGSALAEVCGDAALLVNPHSEDAIAEGLENLTADQELRNELRQRGRVRSGMFPWERAVESTWAVYREIL